MSYVIENQITIRGEYELVRQICYEINEAISNNKKPVFTVLDRQIDSASSDDSYNFIEYSPEKTTARLIKELEEGKVELAIKLETNYSDCVTFAQKLGEHPDLQVELCVLDWNTDGYCLTFFNSNTDSKPQVFGLDEIDWVGWEQIVEDMKEWNAAGHFINQGHPVPQLESAFDLLSTMKQYPNWDTSEGKTEILRSDDRPTQMRKL